MKIFLVTEVCFHTAYLINMLAKDKSDLGNPNCSIQILLRNKKSLKGEDLSLIHQKFQNRKELTDTEMSEIGKAYGAELSAAEKALIKLHGVTTTHALTFAPAFMTHDLNSAVTLDWLNTHREQAPLAAIIFLDCILKKSWLELFENRIVNAHSAILPHARGMYAIEQVAATGDSSKFKKSAGASIHYIDESVDAGLLIKTKALTKLWEFVDIWQVKAASYFTAFSLIIDYLKQSTNFTRVDGAAYTQAMGTIYKAKEFTDEVKDRAVKGFASMQYKEFMDSNSLLVFPLSLSVNEHHFFHNAESKQHVNEVASANTTLKKSNLTIR